MLIDAKYYFGSSVPDRQHAAARHHLLVSSVKGSLLTGVA
jgi:hypothetical protein